MKKYIHSDKYDELTYPPLPNHSLYIEIKN